MNRLKRLLYLILTPLKRFGIGIIRGFRYVVIGIGSLVFILGIIFLGVFFLFDREYRGAQQEENILYAGTNARKYESGSKDAAEIILRINVSGLILGEKPLERGPFDGLNMLGITYGYEIATAIREVADSIAITQQNTAEQHDKKIVGLVIGLNTPGGTVFGSSAISEAINYFRIRTGLPVYSDITGAAVSGGYWIAAATDKIYAHPGTSVGSIGVISGPFSSYSGTVAVNNGFFLGGVTTTGGIAVDYFTAGDGKDIGNPYRQLSQTEQDILQENVDSIYQQFVSHVSDNRAIDEETIRETWGAFVFTASQALDREMIDNVGGTYDVYTNISDDAKIFTLAPTPLSFLGSLQISSLIPNNKTILSEKLIESSIQSFCSQAQGGVVYHGNLSAVCSNTSA